MLHDLCTMTFSSCIFKISGVTMALPTKIKNKDGSTSYRIFLSINGKRESKTFSTRQLCIDWSEKRRREVERAEVHGEKSMHVISEVIELYQAKFADNYGRTKNYDIERLKHYPISTIQVDKLTATDIIEHCVERNKVAKPQTVGNDVIWLRSILLTMGAVMGFDYDASVFDKAYVVLRKENLVAKSNKRTRLPTWREMLKLTRFFKQSRSKTPMVDIVWFAYFSARRLSEITRIEWADNNNEKQTGMVRDTKHPTEKKGNHLRFKYEKSAWKIAQKQPLKSIYIFPYNSRSIGTYFDRACNILGINDLHFHDLRHAAATRLFRTYQIQEVQQFTLHRNWKTLERYTHIKPEDID